MNRNEQLTRIMSAQADLMEALVETLGEAQQALVHSDRPRLERSIRREEDLLRPFHELERERSAKAMELAGKEATVQALLPALTPDDKDAILEISTRMKSASQKILELNKQNTMLIRNARKFVAETLRIVTDDNRRKLVDERI
jgi:hypothetical protein